MSDIICKKLSIFGFWTKNKTLENVPLQAGSL